MKYYMLDYIVCSLNSIGFNMVYNDEVKPKNKIVLDQNNKFVCDNEENKDIINCKVLWTVGDNWDT